MEFTVQVSTFVELKLLWNQKVGNEIVITRCLRYYDNNSTRPQAAPSDLDYYQLYNIPGPCYNYYVKKNSPP